MSWRKPYHRRAGKSRINRPEQGLQAVLAQYLSLKFPRHRSPVVWFAVPNGGARSPVEAAILQGQGVLAGVSDLLIFWPGGRLAVEVKSDAGKLSEAQQTFRADWIVSGGEWAEARTLEDLQAALTVLQPDGAAREGVAWTGDDYRFADKIARRLLSIKPIGQEGRSARDKCVAQVYEVFGNKEPSGWDTHPDDVDLATELARIGIKVP